MNDFGEMIAGVVVPLAVLYGFIQLVKWMWNS